MKLYDKIYIPAQQTAGGEYEKFVSSDPVIVLAIEELEDVFNRGGDYALMPMGYPNFKQYLQSKGINI